MKQIKISDATKVNERLNETNLLQLYVIRVGLFLYSFKCLLSLTDSSKVAIYFHAPCANVL